MDVQQVLKEKIEALPIGPHLNGLRAVMAHIEAAVRHYSRGQEEPDDSLFTDVIFRCNQAFEGSIKEAYRALADKDPQHSTPAKIEKFLASSNLLKPKVLEQFTRYRQEWRNPSTHDYTLDFDDDEALIAIVSVTVFAIVLCDQIAGKFAFDVAAAAAPSDAAGRSTTGPLLDLVTSKVFQFASEHVDDTEQSRSSAQDYYRLEGTLAGFLSAELGTSPHITVMQDERLSSNARADVVVTRGSEKIVIELKRTSNALTMQSVVNRALIQSSFYLHIPDVVGVVALVYSPFERQYHVDTPPEPLPQTIRLVSPAASPFP